jgi:two-component system, LuxR family, response regulator FixJ
METMTDNAVVHLVDDDEDVRRALAFLLATAGLEVRVYESSAALLENFDTAQSGCIVSDVRMPGMDGIQLLRHLRKKGVTLPVIIMTGHADVALAVGAMKAGAVDFIEKPFSDDVLLAAIAAALEQQGSSGQPASEAVAQVRSRLGTLSEREKQVLAGLLAGHPNKTIAYDLGISPRTVEVHRASVMKKLSATSLSQLVRMALLAGNS